MKRKPVIKASATSCPLILFLTFLILKLTGVIGWSWVWVTAPLWGPFVIVLLLVIAYSCALYRHPHKY